MPLEFVEIRNFRCFPVAEARIPSGHDEKFSEGINLFIGPNGSGKTSLFSAIRLAVCREFLTSGGEGPSGRKLSAGGDRRNDFRCGSKSWSVVADFSFGQPAQSFMAQVEQAAPRQEPLYTLNGQRVDRDRLTPDQARVHSRLFHMGWPRRIRDLPGGAFHKALDIDQSTNNNPEMYARRWDFIRGGVEKWFGCDLGPSAPRFPPPDGVFGSDLRDPNGKPLLEGADGLQHVVYLVLEIEKHPWSATFLIEEPDTYLHPGLQRRFVDYLASRTVPHSAGDPPHHQFLVATHSPYIINAVAERWRDHGPDDPRRPKLFQMRRGPAGVTVEDLEGLDDRWSALAALGHRPSDVLLPNGIIWVEGPSDAIYLKHWLTKYARESQPSYEIVWGRDAEVMWYGGSQWKHLAHRVPRLWKGMEEEDRRALVDLLTMNRNCAVVIDRDKDPPGLEGNKGQAPNKLAVKKCLEAARPPRLVWVTGPECIEGFVPANSNDKELAAVFRRARRALPRAKKLKGHNKVKAADDYVRATAGLPWGEIVDTDVETQLREVYQRIREWAGGGNPVNDNGPAG